LDSREPRLLLDQPRRLRRCRRGDAFASKELPDSAAWVDGFELGSAQALQFVARAAPRLYPSPAKEIIRVSRS